MGKSPRVSASEAMPFRPSAQILPRVARRASGESRQTPRISKVLEPPRPPLVLRHFLQNQHARRIGHAQDASVNQRTVEKLVTQLAKYPG